jgi:hypothetical protein
LPRREIVGANDVVAVEIAWERDGEHVAALEHLKAKSPPPIVVPISPHTRLRPSDRVALDT